MALLRCLEGKRGRGFWRSLGELARDPEVVELLQREFPGLPSVTETPVGRRRLLE